MASKDVRNLVAGFLWASGGLAFLVSFYLKIQWAEAASPIADATKGFIHLCNVNDHVGYWSAFQTTSSAILFSLPVPLAMLGVVVMPRKNSRYVGKGPLFEMTWHPDDPRRLQRWGIVGGAVFTVLLFGRIGPAIVEMLNTHGIVLNC